MHCKQNNLLTLKNEYINCYYPYIDFILDEKSTQYLVLQTESCIFYATADSTSFVKLLSLRIIRFYDNVNFYGVTGWNEFIFMIEMIMMNHT